MRLRKNYLQDFEYYNIKSKCDVSIYVPEGVSDATSLSDVKHQLILILVSQHSLDQRCIDSFPQIATLIYKREKFTSPEQIEWYHDCAIRADGPTLWKMSLEYIGTGWPWHKTYCYKQAGAYQPIDRTSFFSQVATEDPMCAIIANVDHNERTRQDVANFVYANGMQRAWFDEVETPPAAMRDLLLSHKDNLPDIATQYTGETWLFMVKKHNPDRAEVERTFYRAQTVDAVYHKLLAVCEEAMHQADVWISFVITTDPYRQEFYADLPVKELN